MNAKRIVRGVLSRTGLGNKVARLFWEKAAVGPHMNYLFKNTEEVFKDIPVAFADPGFSEFIAKDSRKWSMQDEFVLEINNALVEPERCIAIVGSNKFVEQTTILNHHYPYIFPFLFKKLFPKKIGQAVLYDGYGSSNNYHHFVNAVNSLQMLDKADLPPGIPFIINEKSFNSRFFQYLYAHNEKFRSFNWVVQKPSEWLQVHKLYRLQCVHFGKAPWLKTLELYKPKPQQSFRKVFLSRDSSRYNRCLTNEKQISAMLEKYGFETVYLEHLSIAEQIEVFQQTKYMVALHGAGLVYQVFMNYDQAHIIEVLPRDYLIGLYYWEAFALGIKYYDVIVGSTIDQDKNYHLSESQLEENVVKMLAYEAPGKQYGLSHLN